MFVQVQKLFISGGIVMIPLLIFSLLSVTLIMERLFFWLNILNNEKRFIKESLKIYRSNLHTGDVQMRLMSFVQKNLDLPTARMFFAALQLEYPNPIEFKLALESAGQAELQILKRFNNLLETISGIAPLLGLLGTILGLIQAFASLKIGEIGGGNTVAVSTGISEALISTASGLVVGIFTLFFANIFRGLYKKEFNVLQQYGSQLELIYHRKFEEMKIYRGGTGLSLNGDN